MSLRLPEHGEPLSVILKLPGETCNINCYYCYEKRKPYPGSATLDPGLLRDFLRSMGDRPLALELHGGEPLIIGQRKMRPLLQEIRRYPGPVRLTMQTNGTLLNDSWLDLFDEEFPDLEIGISLDGDPAANVHRVDFRDRPIDAKVARALELMARRGRRVGVIAVVTRAALGRADAMLDHFAAFDSIRSVKLAPCLDFNVRTKTFPVGNRTNLMQLNASGEGVPGWATAPMEYADFVIEVFDLWRTRELFRRFMIEPITSIIRTLDGRPTAFCHFSELKCAHVLTLYPDGRLGSCDELSLPDALLSADVRGVADIEDVLLGQGNAELGARLDRLLSKCESCAYQQTCGGGCLATRLRYQDTDLDDEYCAYRMKVIDHIAAHTTPGHRPAAHVAGRARNGSGA